MKEQFTKGPWETHKYNADAPGKYKPVYVQLPGGYRFKVAETIDYWTLADFIAATPDMYSEADNLLQLLTGDDDICAAFSKMVKGLRDQDKQELIAAVERLDNSLAKARGENGQN